MKKKSTVQLKLNNEETQIMNEKLKNHYYT